MAAGSQALKGNCALFVHAAIINIPLTNPLSEIPEVCEGIKEKLGMALMFAKEIKINASPTRFLMPVSRPELRAFLLL